MDSKVDVANKTHPKKYTLQGASRLAVYIFGPLIQKCTLQGASRLAVCFFGPLIDWDAPPPPGRRPMAEMSCAGFKNIFIIL